jgi:hypothetical protein
MSRPFPPRVVVSIAFITLAGCAGTTQPPKEPPSFTGAAPEITGGKYAVYQTERTFNAPLEPLRAFIEDGNKIVAAMEETDNIKKPIETVVLYGHWPEEGAVRRLEFSDGHYTLERVLENDHPTLFRYQVWDFTAAAGNNLEYALGEQSWEALPDGTSKLTWTYSLKPNAGYKRFFVQRFVNNDMRPLMDNALDVVKAQADTAFAERAS